MRSLAAFLSERDPDIFAICEIDAGDALALATRFERQWAYRGAQAIFWNRNFRADAVRDEYLPFSVARPFERRGLLRVEGSLFGTACALIATQITLERDVRIPELRALRRTLRAIGSAAILFVHLPNDRIEFADLGFVRADSRQIGDAAERIYVQRFRVEEVTLDIARSGIGAPLIAQVVELPTA